MQAIKVIELGKAEVREVPIPKLRPDYILVKVEAVALNPADWKSLDSLSIPGSTCGNDLAGTVIDVGSEVTAPIKKGDRVAGLVHACNNVELEDGAFGDYALLKGDVAIKLPESMSFEDGSTLGVAVYTIGLGLYERMGLALTDQPVENEKAEWVFVHGGATAMGTFAIQMAKLSGYKIISSSSPRNFDLVKSYGADVVLDYNSPNFAAEIRKVTENDLYYAFDIISDETSTALCADVLSTNTVTKKPIYSSLYAGLVPFPRDEVVFKFTFAYTMIGKGYVSGPINLPPSSEDFEFGKKFVKVVEKLLQAGRIKVHPVELKEGGWKGVLEGMDELREKGVSGKKIVVRVS